jgi:hypothetical protein
MSGSTRSFVGVGVRELPRRAGVAAEPLAPWELRIGRLRVYYEVSDDPAPIVTIRALGTKDRNRVRIGDQSWESGQPQEIRIDEDPGDDAGHG